MISESWRFQTEIVDVDLQPGDISSLENHGGRGRIILKNGMVYFYSDPEIYQEVLILMSNHEEKARKAHLN